MDATILNVLFLFTASWSMVSCDLISMGSMIAEESETVKSLWGAMTRYNLYGCYCGAGGYGLPVDAIDCCCEIHDKCYDNLGATGICKSGDAAKVTSYKYTKENENGHHTVHCDSQRNTDECAAESCKCDKALADCFARFDKHATGDTEYNNAHRSYDRKKKCNKSVDQSAIQQKCANVNE